MRGIEVREAPDEERIDIAGNTVHYSWRGDSSITQASRMLREVASEYAYESIALVGFDGEKYVMHSSSDSLAETLAHLQVGVKKVTEALDG